MVCGGFACSRNALCALNVVYVLVGVLLIGVAAWVKGVGIVSSLHIIGGVIIVGFFLLLIAIVGLIGAINHHQVMLFFLSESQSSASPSSFLNSTPFLQYMITLGLVFICQFGVSCSCLALKKEKQEKLLISGWVRLDDKVKKSVENNLNCCGLFNTTTGNAEFKKDFISCKAACKKSECPSCGDVMMEYVGEALKILGGVGLFFSFTEILGVWLAMRYRNQKDPRANPSAFL